MDYKTIILRLLRAFIISQIALKNRKFLELLKLFRVSIRLISVIKKSNLFSLEALL